MRRIGLRVEILVNLLFLTAVAMLLLGIIAFKITEGFVLRGKIDSAKIVADSFEAVYTQEKSVTKAISYLTKVLEPGARGFIAYGERKIEFNLGASSEPETVSEEEIREVMRTGNPLVKVQDSAFLPLSYSKGFKLLAPLKDGGKTVGVIYLHQPLDSVQKRIDVGQKYIVFWIIIDLVAMALFGSWLLSKRVVAPVEQLIRFTRDIARGKRPMAKNPGWVKEINLLYQALFEMYIQIESHKDKLEENIQALKDSNEKLQKTQRELIASEKLASSGVLAAGVAHEIGNPLSAIRGYVEVIKRGSGMPEEAGKEFLGKIEREVERINKIIKTLLDYSRPTSYDVRDADMNDLVRHTVEIVKTQGALKKIKLALELSDGLPEITIDPSQFSQVLINLILNARDAMEGSGSITISTRKHPHGGVEVTVRDTGPGIPQENIDKIFDPFFTTKEPGKGTGLGLAVSLRIVQHFSGTMTAKSTEGEGALFSITFPEARENAA